jgi:ubiquinone/menaquinone biosynthesis C-methylase UbiE
MKLIRAFMRFFFHHFYHSLSWTYDFVAAIVSVGRWRDWGRTTLPLLSGTRVLELGFGPGHLQVALAAAGFQTFGLDESRQMCHRAAANISHKGFPLRLTRGYTQALPFASESFDSLVATFPSEYIVAAETLSEAWRVLKSGGRLVVALSALPGNASLPDRAAAWLFRVTGQGGMITDQIEDRLKTYFTAGRFTVSLIRTEIRQSTVILVVAEKSASPKTFESTE